MKALACSHVWWPSIDNHLEKTVKSCSPYQVNHNTPPKAPLHPWVWPTYPWQRIHVDFAGPVAGKMLLIAVDAHLKWLEVIPMSSTTAGKTIKVLRNMFARWGIPEQLVTDNDPQFTRVQSIRHVQWDKKYLHSSLPPSQQWGSGIQVQTVKKALQAGHQRGTPLEHCLAAFLLNDTTDVALSSLLVGHILQTRLDLLDPMCLHMSTQNRTAKILIAALATKRSRWANVSGRETSMATLTGY